MFFKFHEMTKASLKGSIRGHSHCEILFECFRKTKMAPFY